MHDLSQLTRPAASGSHAAAAAPGATAIPPAPPAPPVPSVLPATGLTTQWKALQVVAIGLAALCLGLFGYRIWLGREPAPITIGAFGGGQSLVEIKMC